MDKKSLNEADIRTKFIMPALDKEKGGSWDLMTQLREEYPLTEGRVIVRGKTAERGKAKKADYVLFYKPGIPLAVIEAKDNNHAVGDGMQQALEYARLLNAPFAYSSNGDAFLEHDRTSAAGAVEREIPMGDFPSPRELWNRSQRGKGYADGRKAAVEQDYYDDGSGREPRYYQLAAVNAAVDAVARGENRVLLVMATGSGKTYTAFQIIWRLWKSGAKKRILFLVDRNNLADQTMTNDFKPFGSAMTKIRGRKIDKSYEVYIALYQAVTGESAEKDAYLSFSRDFFDLVVVDECHRGSADANADWRRVLEHFSSATQIGMTATPKETRDISNIKYFGEPVYTYSLRQGIADGFLAPYKVVRYDLDKDLGWRPEKGKKDKHGMEIEDREYNVLDMDARLVLDKRTELVAAKVTEFLKDTGRYSKTVIFCVTSEHAGRVRSAMVNANSDIAAAESRYVMRITANDDAGKEQLDNFKDPESAAPAVAVTSRLLSTGSDIPTCRLIVIDRHIASMTEFKQIIGRGSRIREDHGKLFFTIMDFRGATNLFSDPGFDGEPVCVYQPEWNESPIPPDEEDGAGSERGKAPGNGGEGNFLPVKYYVDDVPVAVARERVQYLDGDGKLITESLLVYSRNAVRKSYASFRAFRERWDSAERKREIIDELAKQGVFFDELAKEVGGGYDAFDLVCHVAFDQPPLTRRERAGNVKKRNIFAKYGGQARAVLDALLEKYEDSGIQSVEDMGILRVAPLRGLGTPVEIVKMFGGKEEYLAAVREMENALYEKAA